MSSKPESSPERDELHDRLVDAALREVVGGKTPPDVSDAILARAQMNKPVERAVGNVMLPWRQWRPIWRRSPWQAFAIAATVLVVAAGLLLPKLETGREAARRGFTPVQKQNVDDAPQAQPQLESAAGTQQASQPEVSQQGVAQPAEPDLVPRDSESTVEAAAEAPLATLETEAVPDDDWTRYADASDAGSASAPLDHSQTVADLGLGAQSPNRLDAIAAAAKPSAGEGQVQWEPMYQRDQQGQQRFGYQQNAIRGARRFPGKNSAVVTDDDSRMMSVTPGIIIEEHEHDRLAIHDQRTLVDESGLGVGGFEGRGPELGGDKYEQIVENAFKAVSAANTDNRLSTFSIDVDTASYANVRQFLRDGSLPPADAVRIEELVNYFDYDYSPPTGDVPFAAHIEVAGCPWAPEHRLVRIGVKGREIERTARPKSNLVFLIDVSGSMDEPNKLPLLVDGLRMMTRELGENDRVAIVVYASSEGLALESTPGTEQPKILAALDQLAAGGSTAGGAGIQLAYKVAEENFSKGGVNRVILCTDGDFNVGVTSPAELERMAAKQAKDTGVFLTVLGFGRGNLNDAMMEQVADRGNGNYHYVDSRQEARKVLVEEMSATLVTIAKDVKLQVEFNPAKVAGYRLIGYENRVLAAEDFNDDTKDAGEIGAGHTVTALYEVVPAGKSVDAAEVDGLRYAAPKSKGDESAEKSENASSDELLTLKIRYKEVDGVKSSKLEFPVEDSDERFAKASDDFKFAAAVASFGMLLRDSQYKGNATYAAVAEIAEAAGKSRDPHGYRKEFVELVNRAKQLSGE